MTQPWRGKPLVSYQTIVQLIAATTTRTALNVKAEIDHATYPAGVKVTDNEMAASTSPPTSSMANGTIQSRQSPDNDRFVDQQSLRAKENAATPVSTVKDMPAALTLTT